MNADLSVGYLCFLIQDAIFLLSFLLIVSSNYKMKLRNSHKLTIRSLLDYKQGSEIDK